MGGCAALRSRAVVLVVEGIKSEDNKKPSIFMLGFVRADEGTRTPTVLLPLEPESSASANSATSADFRLYLTSDFWYYNKTDRKSQEQFQKSNDSDP